MIAFDNVSARVRGSDVIAVTFRHEQGPLAIVGAATDGAAALLTLAAGLARPSRGTIARHPDAETAWIPLAPDLVEGLRVRELFELAAEQRREPARANERLRAFDLESLGARDTRTLDIAEMRAVLACEALTSTKTTLVLFEEPLVRNTASAVTTRSIRDHKGIVLVATASPRDAHALADRYAVMRQGRLLAMKDTLDPIGVFGLRGIRSVATVSDASALAAALAKQGIDRLEVRENTVTAIGDDANALARAMQKAMLDSKVTIESLVLEPLALESLQAVATAEATAAYEAALARSRVPTPVQT